MKTLVLTDEQFDTLQKYVMDKVSTYNEILYVPTPLETNPVRLKQLKSRHEEAKDLLMLFQSMQNGEAK